MQNTRVIRLHEKDNVATALEDLPTGTSISLPNLAEPILLIQDIKFGHKFALSNLAVEERVYKYGVPIGIVTQSIKAGEHVHLQNLIGMQQKRSRG